jgi:hypothetical protein
LIKRSLSYTNFPLGILGAGNLYNTGMVSLEVQAAFFIFSIFILLLSIEEGQIS